MENTRASCSELEISWNWSWNPYSRVVNLTESLLNKALYELCRNTNGFFFLTNCNPSILVIPCLSWFKIFWSVFVMLACMAAKQLAAAVAGFELLLLQ